MKWFFVILFSLFGILFLWKGIELWTVLGHVNSDGIEIRFLGFEVIDYVMKESIPSFALGFTIAALTPILMAVNMAIKISKTATKKQPEV